MNRRVLGILFLLWLAWYLSGPLFETIDFWDTPQEEMVDVFWSASGTLSLMAVGLCVGVFLFRRIRELCCSMASSLVIEKSVQVPAFKHSSSTSLRPSPSLDITSLRI